MNINVQTIFTPELANSNSDEFQTLAESLEEQLDNNLQGLGSSKVTGFSQKSQVLRTSGVQASLKITFFESSESLDTQQDLIVAASQQAIDSSPQMTGTPTITKDVHQSG